MFPMRPLTDQDKAGNRGLCVLRPQKSAQDGPRGFPVPAVLPQILSPASCRTTPFGVTASSCRPHSIAFSSCAEKTLSCTTTEPHSRAVHKKKTPGE